MEDSQFYGMCHVRENVNQGPDLLNILRQSYDNAKVTIDFMTHKLQNILGRVQDVIHSQNYKLVWDSVCEY